MEQGTGIEPAFTAWEAVVLPIYEPCVQGDYSKYERKIQPLFVEGYIGLQNPADCGIVKQQNLVAGGLL